MEEGSDIQAHASISAYDFYMRDFEASVIMSSGDEEIDLGPLATVDVYKELTGEAASDSFWTSAFVTTVILIIICGAPILGIVLCIKDGEIDGFQDFLNEIAGLGAWLAVLPIYPWIHIFFNRLFNKLGEEEVGQLYPHPALFAMILLILMWFIILVNASHSAKKEKEKEKIKRAKENAIAVYQMQEKEKAASQANEVTILQPNEETASQSNEVKTANDKREDSSPEEKVGVLLLSSTDEAKKLSVIQLIRDEGSVDLKSAIEKFDDLPQVIRKDISRKEAEVIVAKFAKFGAETKIL